MSKNRQNQDEFGPIRKIIWPVYKNEAKSISIKFLLYFTLCLCYSILRNVKDAVLLTSSSSGGEIIPFIKFWGILPGAFLITWIYTKISNHFSRKNVFYIIVSSFLIYFLLFAFVLYPNHKSLHFYSLAETLSANLPRGFNGLILMIKNWTFSSFYILSELWASLILSVLLWGIINDLCEISQAKRVYGLLNIGSNLAPIVGGILSTYIVQEISIGSSLSSDPWGASLIKLILTICSLGVTAMLLFHFLTVCDHKRWQEINHRPSGAVKKKKLSLLESIKYISKSKYLSSIAIIVLAYNCCINFTDTLWKSQLNLYFRNQPEKMLTHMNGVTIGIGIFATIGAISFSSLISRYGWKITALVTPIIMGTTSLFFFSSYFGGTLCEDLFLSYIGITPLALTTFIGSMQNCLVKAGKYSVFDASKEISFLREDIHSRAKGKAAIDGLGSGIGKSGSSLTNQALLIMLGSLSFSAPYIAAIIFLLMIIWISAVQVISREFKKNS